MVAMLIWLRGNYGLRVTDYYNCKDSSLSAEINEPDPLVIVSEVSDSNTITVVAGGGTPPYVYTLSGGSPRPTGEFVDLQTAPTRWKLMMQMIGGPIVSREFEINIIAIEEQDFSALQIFPNLQAANSTSLLRLLPKNSHWKSLILPAW